MNTEHHISTIPYQFVFVKHGQYERREQCICREAPLTIQINGVPYMTLMRTPGLEKELAIGVCFSDGLIASAGHVTNMTDFPDPDMSYIRRLNLLIPSLGRKNLSREALLKSSSGSLNASSLLQEADVKIPRITSALRYAPAVVETVPDKLADAQHIRALCGATHGAALFDRRGTLVFCAEDVGRHNGLDKLIGYALLNGIEASETILMLSSRASVEMMHKAVRFGVPLVATLSAPTDLALQLAEKANCTYLSFRKTGGYHVYTHAWRLGFA